MQNFFRVTLSVFLKIFYKIDSIHMDRLPKTGGVLMIANHVSYIDWLILSLACPRPIRFIFDERFEKKLLVGWFTRLFSSLPVDSRRTRSVIRKTVEAISNGDIVCIFPEGQLSRTGVMNELKKGFTLIASQAKAPIQPVYIDSMWGSNFSFERNRFFKKWPHHLRYPVTLNIGELIPYQEATPESAREALLNLSAESLQHRVSKQLPHKRFDIALIQALKQHPNQTCLIEAGKKIHRLKREQILGLSIALARHWKNTLDSDSDKVAIFLPPGAAPIYLNLGLMIAGKIPVNLPFQHQPDLDQLSATLEQNGITTLISSRAFFPKIEALLHSQDPSYQLLDMRSEIDDASGVRIMMERLLARFEPLASTLRRLELSPSEPHKLNKPVFGIVTTLDSTNDSPANTLFLSGLNLLSQNHQLTQSINLLSAKESIFCESPLNTPEGFLFSLFLPVFSHTTAAMRSFGSQTQNLPTEPLLTASDSTTLILSPSLCQQILSEETWHPELKSQIRQCLYFQHSDGENNPAPQLEKLSAHIDTPVLTSYAPTELATILSVSMLNPPKGSAASLDQYGNRAATLGRLLPGIGTQNENNLSVCGPNLSNNNSDPNPWHPLPPAIEIDNEGFVLLDTEAKT